MGGSPGWRSAEAKPLFGSLVERQESGKKGVVLGRLCRSNWKVPPPKMVKVSQPPGHLHHKFRTPIAMGMCIIAEPAALVVTL